MAEQRRKKQQKKSSLEELKKELEKCQKEKADFLAGWQRAKADFLNYKKEEAERVEEILKYGNEDLILKILPILDNIYIAEQTIPKELKSNQWVEGILKTKTQILDFLKNQKVEEIKGVGERFDPNFHEAVGEIERQDKKPGIIIEEIQKGYKLDGKVIRPARVKVVR